MLYNVLGDDLLIPSAVKNILIKLEENGYEAYLVGGFVRDYLLNRNTNDFDIATNAIPKDVIEIFGPSKKKIEYGSYHLKIEDFNIDITTYRKEGAYKDRRPVTLEYTSNLILDAQRRDFTMNALYMNKNGEIIDPLHVVEDVKKKKLKMIGNPMIRFQEDPLRILRAVRFACTYDLKLDKEMVKAIKKEKKNLMSLSKERIKKELDLILLSRGFSYLKDLNLLTVLGIETKKIVYVEDLAGLWAQIKTSIEYPKEKNLKKREKSIAEQINCGTMDMLSLYKHGYYDSRVICTILKIPLKRLDKLAASLPIHSRSEMAYSPKEIESLACVHGYELGELLNRLEEGIVKGKIENTKEGIELFLKR